MIWAFGFANLPLLQFGIAAASLPILIHLLNRRKYREMRWAAMRFLVAALQKNQRRVRIEQWLLLAARTLVILLAVGAMAKPFLESLGAVVLPGQRTHRVIVLDGSMSMAFVAGDQPRFEQAKALAGQLVRDARRGDVLSVVLMGEPPRVVVGDASPSANGGEVIKEIDSIRRPDGATDLVASFEAVDRVLGVSPVPRKEVIVVTDLQAASWRRPEAGSQAEPLRRAVAKLEARSVVSVVIDLGKEGGENRAVTDFRLDAPLVTVGGSAPRVIATVKNFGGKPAYDVKARLSIDGQVGPDQSIPEIAPGGEGTVAFLPGFAAAGDHLVEVRIDDDALPVDNKRSLVVPVRDALNVLLVDGSPKPEPFQGEIDYLVQALNPDERSSDPGAAGEGLPPAATIRTEVVSEAQVRSRDLSPFDAVVLCNVAEFAPAEVAALDAFLKQGGGVVFFAGDAVAADNYNRLLFADGRGMLPASVEGTVGDRSKQGAYEFDAKDFRHPIVNPFQGATAPVLAGLTGAKTWQYAKLKVPTDGSSRARVALWFNTGDPAIVEAPRHRGRVIQVATSADVDWTTWPLHQSYPPIMEQVVLEAAAGRLSERNVRVGQPIDRALPAAAGGAAVEVARPDGPPVATQLQPSGDVSLFHFEDTDLAGLYRARFAAPLGTESLFAANPDPRESDPAKLDRAGLAEAVPGWKPAILTNWRDLSQSATTVGRRGELHRPLLYALLGMLLVESTMAWWFGHHRR